MLYNAGSSARQNFLTVAWDGCLHFQGTYVLCMGVWEPIASQLRGLLAGQMGGLCVAQQG